MCCPRRVAWATARKAWDGAWCFGAAAVWTRDIGRALRTARAIRAGVVWINDSQPAPSETMWGGYKQSGIGRELGRYALDSYLESKHIYINLAN